MSTFNVTPTISEFRVIHPLDDVAERKCSGEGLGPIRMTRPVRLSLWVLRGYLLAMTLMLVYHVLNLAGIAAKLR